MILIARIISIISNPLVLSAPLSYSLVLKSSNDVNYSLLWAAASVLFTSIIGLFVFFGVKRGMFSNFDVSVREERKPVFIVTAIVGFSYMFVVFLLHGPTILLATAGALLLGVFIDSVVNRKVKASVHLAVFSSFSLILAILYGGIFWILPFLAPIVAWSRIKLKRHELSETIVGTLIGMFLVAIFYIILKYLIIK